MTVSQSNDDPYSRPASPDKASRTPQPNIPMVHITPFIHPSATCTNLAEFIDEGRARTLGRDAKSHWTQARSHSSQQAKKRDSGHPFAHSDSWRHWRVRSASRFSRF